MMVNNKDLASVLPQYLPILDNILSQHEVPLQERPLAATRLFVENFVLEIEDKLGRWKPDRLPVEVVTERWFNVLNNHVTDWYHARYGDKFREQTSKTISGCVMIFNVPYLLETPFILTVPGEPGKTIIMRFPGSVMSDENPLSWLISPPNFDLFSEEERLLISKECQLIATYSRSIMTKLMGVDSTDKIVAEMLANVLLKIQLAARVICRGSQEGSIGSAYWEIQLACECVYKAYLQQKAGGYIETHDLFRLHDEAANYQVSVARNLIRNIPRSREIIDMRYRIGTQGHRDFYGTYISTLQIVEGVLSGMISLWLQEASFTIKNILA